jgi:hypothetical protein
MIVRQFGEGAGGENFHEYVRLNRTAIGLGQWHARHVSSLVSVLDRKFNFEFTEFRFALFAQKITLTIAQIC